MATQSRLSDSLCDLEKFYSSHKHGHKTKRFKRRLCLAALVGVFFEARWISTMMSTGLACAAGLYFTLSTLTWRGRRKIPYKIFYVDAPVTGVVSVGEGSLIYTGGGGGLTYGVEDITQLLHLDEESSVSDPSASADENIAPEVNLFGIEEAALDVKAGRKLEKLTLKIVDFCPMRLLWGLRADANLFAGGSGHFLVLSRVTETHSKMETLLRLQVIGDTLSHANSVVHRVAVSARHGLVAAISESHELCVVGIALGASRFWQSFAQAPLAVLGTTRVDVSDLTRPELSDVAILDARHVAVSTRHAGGSDLRVFRIEQAPTDRTAVTPFQTRDAWGGSTILPLIPLLGQCAKPMALPVCVKFMSVLAATTADSNEVSFIAAGNTLPTKRGEKARVCLLKGTLTLGSGEVASAALLRSQVINLPFAVVTSLSLSEDGRLVGVTSPIEARILGLATLKTLYIVDRAACESSSLPTTSSSFPVCVDFAVTFTTICLSLVVGGRYAVAVSRVPLLRVAIPSIFFDDPKLMVASELYTIWAFREASFPQLSTPLSIAIVEEFITKINEWRDFWIRAEVSILMHIPLSSGQSNDSQTGALRWLALHQPPLTELDHPSPPTAPDGSAQCRSFGCCACFHTFEFPVSRLLLEIDECLDQMLPRVWSRSNRSSATVCWPQVQRTIRQWICRRDYRIERCLSIDYASLHAFIMSTRFACALANNHHHEFGPRIIGAEVNLSSESPVRRSPKRSGNGSTAEKASKFRMPSITEAGHSRSSSYQSTASASHRRETHQGSPTEKSKPVGSGELHTEWHLINHFIGGLPDAGIREYIEGQCPQTYSLAVAHALHYSAATRRSSMYRQAH